MDELEVLEALGRDAPHFIPNFVENRYKETIKKHVKTKKSKFDKTNSFNDFGNGFDDGFWH